MKKRVFLAVNLPLEIKEKIGGFSVKLQNLIPRKSASFPKAENLHITLHFLGNQDERGMERIRQVAEGAAGRGKIFAGLGGFGAFPNLRHPRVLFLDIAKGLEELDALKSALGRGLKSKGFEVDERPFNGHITLARVKTAIPDLGNIGKDAPKAAWQVGSFELMESKLSPKGATYTVLESFKL